MSLRERVVLEIDVEDDSGTVHNGVFEFEDDLEHTHDVSRRFVMGDRGQYISSVANLASEVTDANITELPTQTRRGYHLDGGMGAQEVTFQFAYSAAHDGRWGDGSSASGDFNEWDAPGEHPVVGLQVFEHYVARSQLDSRGKARLHIGEWTDGTYSSGAGVFGEPWNVTVTEINVDNEQNEPSAASGTFTARRVALLPDIESYVTDVQDALSEYIPDH